MDRQEYRHRLSARLRGARAESGLSQNHADLSQWSRYVAGTDERVRAALPTV